MKKTQINMTEKIKRWKIHVIWTDSLKGVPLACGPLTKTYLNNLEFYKMF